MATEPDRSLPPTTEESSDSEPLPLPPQETFRKVYFGQVSEPLVPPHPEPPEADADDLAQAAMDDPDDSVFRIPESRPTPWRLVFLLFLAALALLSVFLRRG